MLSGLEQLPSIQFGDFTLQLELDDLSPTAKEIARKELRESSDVRQDAIEALRNLLKSKNDLLFAES